MGDWRWETGGKRQKAGDRRRETGDRRRETGDAWETGDGRGFYAIQCCGAVAWTFWSDPEPV